MTIRQWLPFFFACSIAVPGFAAVEPRPDRYPLREVHASARLPRAIEVFLEVADVQEDPSAGIAAELVLVNRGTNPVTLRSAAEQTVLLLADDKGPREHPAALVPMLPSAHVGEVLPATQLLPGVEVRVPLRIETVFSLLPEDAKPKPRESSGESRKSSGQLTATASAYGGRTASTPEPLGAGTWYVALQTMLIDASAPPDKTGRIFESPFVKVVLGGGAE